MRLWIAAAGCFLVILLFEGGASACECGDTERPPQAFERADLVFFGQVIAVGRATGKQTDGKLFWEFEVEGLWKGPVQSSIRIFAHDFDGTHNACDATFKVDIRYLVYAYLKEGAPHRFRVSKCSRTSTARGSLLDLASLGQPPHHFPE